MTPPDQPEQYIPFRVNLVERSVEKLDREKASREDVVQIKDEVRSIRRLLMWLMGVIATASVGTCITVLATAVQH